MNLSVEEALRYIDQKIARAEHELIEWQRMRALVAQTGATDADEIAATRLLEQIEATG